MKSFCLLVGSLSTHDISLMSYVTIPCHIYVFVYSGIARGQAMSVEQVYVCVFQKLCITMKTLV